MGFYKNRLTTTVTANLTDWLLSGNTVEGTIELSTDRDYIDGVRYIFINKVSFEHYDAVEGKWPAHYLLKTNTEKYFICLDKDQREHEPMA